MNKKVLSLVLALVMVLSTFSSVFAAEDKKEDKKEDTPKAGEKVEKIVGKDNKIQYIVDKKFVEGYEDGSMGYDKHIKRSEITKLVVYANGQKDLAEKLQGARQLYSDVNQEHWANGVISVGSTVPSEANGLPMLNGYPDGSFKPEKDVTYAELAKMLVVLVKEDLTEDMYKNAKWATSWMTWAAQLGILDDVNVTNSDDAATRADAFTMLYNALYKMVEFKRVPANDTIGVLSALGAEKLVLNQDKDKEYKVTKDTVFVRGYEWNNSNIISVKMMRNYDFYYGSLVRILFNDKKEVTHILELGNPLDMALGRAANDPGKNRVWEGVADNTVETAVNNKVNTLKDIKDYDGKSYVKINLNDKKTKADDILFYNEDLDTSSKVVKTLKVNDDTKVYVANPYNNIMKEVDSLKAAMALIGFRNYDEYKIPNVYAGYNSDGRNVTYKPINVGGDRDVAKVVVFNVVSDDKGGDLYRVINSASSMGRTTLEDTDGKLYDRENIKNVNHFPLNYGDLYDVIEIKNFAIDSNSMIDKVLDHSDTVKFPIVEVKEVYGDDHIAVADKYGDKSVLDLRDADIFNAKQYKDLKAGDKVQFKVENDKTNVADVLSILPAKTELAGALKGVIPAAQVEQQVGKLIKVEKSAENNNVWLATLDVDRDIFDGDLKSGVHQFVVDEGTAKALMKLLDEGNDKSLAFKVAAKHFGYAGHYKAYDFRYNDTDNAIIEPAADKVQELKDLVQALANEYGKDGAKVDADNKEAAKEALANIKEKEDALNLDDTAKWKDTDNDAYRKVVKNVKGKVEEIEKQEKDAAKTALNEKLTEANDKKADVAISEDGSDVAKDKTWVKQADQDTFDKAIEKAQGVHDNADATKAELDDAKAELQEAIDAYNPQPGTQQA